MILIALGANLPSHAGSPAATLRAALNQLSQNGAVPLKVSPLYTTPAWPDPRDPEFVNAVARLDTQLPPAQLMELLHDVEAVFGRERNARNAPRTLDLDILDYDGRAEQGPPILPHPRIAGRAFVLIPLRDVAPGWRDPVLGKSVDELIRDLPAEARDTIRIIAA
jgi:2-amino-4-hydroxy-6-hydroxymethyldihydropteridine diphosphokinase